MPTESIQFSVVVPTYNRPKSLTRCLNAIEQLSFDRALFEVIIVDDGSTLPLEPPNTAPDLNIRWLTQTNGGAAHARNAGAAVAVGATLVFIDDDCTVHPDYLSVLSVACQQHPNNMLGGSVVNRYSTDIYAETTQQLVTFLREADLRSDDTPKFFSSNNMLMSKADFVAFGGFNAQMRLGEDREFCFRWCTENRPMQYIPQAIVYHWHALSFIEFWQLHVRYGRGSAHSRRLHTRPTQNIIRIEPLRFYVRLLLFPFKTQPWHKACPDTMLLFIAQIATLVGYGWHFLETIRD
ncbi:MAG: glycosyltransferase [Candidatus Promineifilaceae bacterium]